MRGEQAALIVQAEDHVKRAIYELQTASERCRKLRQLVTDPEVRDGLGEIMDKLYFHVSAIQDAEYEEEFHRYWDS